MDHHADMEMKSKAQSVNSSVGERDMYFNRQPLMVRTTTQVDRLRQLGRWNTFMSSKQSHHTPDSVIQNSTIKGIAACLRKGD